MTGNDGRRVVVLSMLLFASLGITARTADRVRPGQWVGTTVVGGKTYPTSSCPSQSDATALSGDAKAVKAYMETVIPREICAISDVKVDGAKIVYTASCGRGGSKVVTTNYYGDHSEGTDSTGGKTDAKLVGPCKS